MPIQREHYRVYPVHSYATSCGDEMFMAVTECLVSTKLSFEHLNINCPLGKTFASEWTDRKWNQIDFGEVTTVYFGPEFYSLHDPIPRESNNPLKWHYRCADSFITVLRSTANTVQNLKLTGDLDWDLKRWLSLGGLTFELPSLHSIWITDCSFSVSEFFSDISRLPALQSIRLDSCFPETDGGDDAWKAIFDYVREAPRPLSFTFNADLLWDRGGNDGILRSLTCHNEEEVETTSGGTFTEKRLHSLRLYLTNRGGWDDILEKWFPS